eukprot:31285-Pelagococcus_subviridis.AAC.13
MFFVGARSAESAIRDARATRAHRRRRVVSRRRRRAGRAGVARGLPVETLGHPVEARRAHWTAPGGRGRSGHAAARS